MSLLTSHLLGDRLDWGSGAQGRAESGGSWQQQWQQQDRQLLKRKTKLPRQEMSPYGGGHKTREESPLGRELPVPLCLWGVAGSQLQTVAGEDHGGHLLKHCQGSSQGCLGAGDLKFQPVTASSKNFSEKNCVCGVEKREEGCSTRHSDSEILF